MIYGQRTADNRFAFGGRGARYHWGSAIRPEYDRVQRVFDHLRRTLGELFPVLDSARFRDAAVTHRWGGPLGVPRDWHATASYDPATRVAWAGGYVGDGLSTTNLAGRTLADLMTGADSDADAAAVGEPPLAVVGARAAALRRRQRRACSRPSSPTSRSA